MGDTPHSAVGDSVVVLVELELDDGEVVVVVEVDVVVVVVVVIFSAQHSVRSWSSNPQGDLMAASKYLRRDWNGEWNERMFSHAGHLPW